MSKTTSLPDEAAAPEAEHDLDSFRAGDLDPAGGDEGAILEASEDGSFGAAEDDVVPASLDRDAFWETWKIAWSLPASIDPALSPLSVQPESEGRERAASDAIHRLLEIWYPAALQPQSETIGLALVAAPVLIGKAMIIREVLADRRARRNAAPVQAARRPPPPDDGGAPDTSGAGWLQ